MQQSMMLPLVFTVCVQRQAQSSRAGLRAACAAQAQQPAPANGAPGPVVHMRQWLAARISEPARRMLDFHMDTYSMVSHPGATPVHSILF